MEIYLFELVEIMNYMSNDLFLQIFKRRKSKNTELFI